MVFGASGMAPPPQQLDEVLVIGLGSWGLVGLYSRVGAVQGVGGIDTEATVTGPQTPTECLRMSQVVGATAMADSSCLREFLRCIFPGHACRYLNTLLQFLYYIPYMYIHSRYYVYLLYCLVNILKLAVESPCFCIICRPLLWFFFQDSLLPQTPGRIRKVHPP